MLAQLQVWTVADVAGSRPAVAAVSLALTASLLLRRHHPLLVLCCVWAYFPIVTAAGWNTPDVTFFPSAALMLATYSVAAHAGRREALAGAGLVVALVALGAALGEIAPGEGFFILLFNTAAWTGGRLVHTRDEDVAHLTERAERAAVAERARIARELHDVVSHGLSGIALEAAGAERVLDRDPEAARAALASIQQAGRETTAELRRLLGVLRAPHEGPTDAPLPTLRRAAELAERARRAGAAVELHVDGDVGDLPPGVDLAGYRVLQEALTNVVRHAPGATARVAVRRDARWLEIDVRDDGAGAGRDPAPPAGGHGLVGMRERVALYGGELHAGPQPGGGFRVRARLAVAG